MLYLRIRAGGCGLLEKLAGKLRWEQTGTGIRVEIPAQVDWSIVFLIIWFVVWTLVGSYMYARGFTRMFPSLFGLVWVLGWAGAEVAVAATILWKIAGRTTLMLDQSQIAIARRLMGIQFSRQSFVTESVRNLRYRPGGNRGKHVYQSQVLFEAGDKTCSFATGIADSEALALIDRMLDVHKFPKDRALEYMQS